MTGPARTLLGGLTLAAILAIAVVVLATWPAVLG